ncbi:MAG: hypothetical protein ACODAD_10965, partial [Planctomycetota bacterium]
MWVVHRFSGLLNEARLPSATVGLVCATAVSMLLLASCNPSEKGTRERAQRLSEPISGGRKASRRRANRSATRSAT